MRCGLMYKAKNVDTDKALEYLGFIEILGGTPKS